jgi:signal transduction histidine kinase
MNLTPTTLLASNSRPLFAQKPVGCTLMDRDGRIVSVTRAFGEMLGIPGTQLFGQSIFAVLAREDIPKRRNLLAEGVQMRVLAVNSDLPLGWSVHRIAPGAVLGGYYVGLLFKGDDLGPFEDQLAHLDRLALLGGLSAEMIHEIAGPLSVIANNADLLLEENGIDQDARQFLITMRDEAYRLGDLLHDFLFVAREESLKLEPLDILKLVQIPVRLLQHQGVRSNFSLEIQAEENLPKVAGDAERLQQVFFNLLKNACDASPAGGIVQVQLAGVETKQKSAMLEIAIIDQGQGIDSEQFQLIFQPFYSTKPAGQGTGLGLPIARRIVEAHRGELTIESTRGVGTRVTVLLPTFLDEAGNLCNNEKFLS